MEFFMKEQCEQLWTEWEPGLRRLCFMKLSSHPEEAEDCLSEVFLQLAEALHQGKPILNYRAWLYGVAHHKIKDAYEQIGRQQAKIIPVDISDCHSHHALCFSPDYDELLLRERDYIKILRHIEQNLTAIEKDLYFERYVRRQRLTDIAQEWNVSETVMQQRNFRLKRKVKYLVQSELDRFYDKTIPW